MTLNISKHRCESLTAPELWRRAKRPAIDGLAIEQRIYITQSPLRFRSRTLLSSAWWCPSHLTSSKTMNLQHDPEVSRVAPCRCRAEEDKSKVPRGAADTANTGGPQRKGFLLEEKPALAFLAPPLMYIYCIYVLVHMLMK